MRRWILYTVCIMMLVILSSCTNDQAQQANEARGNTSIVVQDRGQVASTEGSYHNNRWTRWINEHSPVNVEYVPVLRSESKQILNVLFASGSAPDIINETNAAFRNYLYEQNQILPLDDLLEYMPNYTALIEKYPQLYEAGVKSDGKLYEIGRVNEANPLHVMFIRKDWLDALNLQMPQTTEDLLEVAYAFTHHDPDQNGINDTYGINISYHSEGAVNEMFGVQQHNSWGWDNGSIIRQWDKEAYALQFKKQLYDQRLVDPKYMNDKDGSKAKQDFINGKIGIYVNHSMNWVGFTMKDIHKLQENSPTAELVPLEYPTSPAGQYIGAIDNPIQMTTVINAAANDPIAAAKYINFVLEETTARALLKGEEQSHWTYADNGCPQLNNLNQWQIEVGYANNGAYGLFLGKGTDPCNFVVNHFNSNYADQAKAIELYNETRKLYMDSTKQYPGITLGDYMPSFPAYLDYIRTDLEQSIYNIYLQAIIGGEQYSVDWAIGHAQQLWEQKGGELITEYVNQWFTDNKANTFLIEDLWGIVEQQQQMLLQLQSSDRNQ